MPANAGIYLPDTVYFIQITYSLLLDQFKKFAFFFSIRLLIASSTA